MDIDEFLDRELADLGIGTPKQEKIGSAVLNDIGDIPVADPIASSHGKGGIEDSEKSYLQLWHALVQQKLKWNRGIYDQLASLSKQFSSILSQSYGEVKRKNSHVFELIARGRNALKEGKKDLPFKIYAEAQEISNSIPNIFFEEKKSLNKQVMNLYREITYATDMDLIKRVSSQMQQISQMIESINSYISSNDFASASASYLKCIELYNHIPEGFLMQKNSAGMRLLDIYKSLSIYNEISELNVQLGAAEIPLQRFASMAAQQAEQPKIFSPSPAAYYKNTRVPAPRHAQMASGLKARNPQASLLNRKRESAKRNIKKGFYNEAWNDVEQALQINPEDAEAKALRARIKTLQ